MGSKPLVPKVRFPEFRETGSWEEVQLRQFASFINDRVGDAECVPYTVTSGVGLVSQDKKFGRTIAGNSLRSYIRLLPNDFAYNKSSTKSCPEGYIARFRDNVKAAVPNSIFTCFRADCDKVEPAYLDYLFAANLHGRWLRNFLTIGARAHGSLNVNDSDLMALPVPLPAGEHPRAEQEKIAECLTSLDELIAAERRRLEALRTHKKGLMQDLFPREGETVPRLRFPEFRDAAEWEEEKLGSRVEIGSGDSPSRFGLSDSGTYPFVKVEDLNNCTKYQVSAREFCDEPHGAIESGSILFPKRGAAIELNKIRIAATDLVIDTNVMAIKPKDGLTSEFLFYYLSSVGLTQIADTSTIPQINNKHIIPFRYLRPPSTEQQRIADCLASLDALITAQAKKLDTLKLHKQGLLQGLFPSPEVTP